MNSLYFHMFPRPSQEGCECENFLRHECFLEYCVLIGFKVDMAN